MITLKKISFILSFICIYFINAQAVTKTDTLSGTPLSFSMDKKIDDAIEQAEDKCVKTSSLKRNTPITLKNDENTNTKTVKLTTNRELTTAEICQKNPRIMGIKIQLVVVKSNDEANEVKAYFRRRFPNIKVETDASLRPNYKILAGSYFSKESARADLAKIRQYFKSATAVQYRIFCVEAK